MALKKIDKHPTSDDIEKVLQVINAPKLIYDKEYEEWICDADNIDLYNESLLYREAILREGLDMPSEEIEWKKFIAGKRKRNRLNPLWIAGAVAIIALLAIPRFFSEKQSGRNYDVIPEFVALNTPQEITLQADNTVPIVIKDIAASTEGKENNSNSIAEPIPAKSISKDRNVQIYTLSIPRGKSYHLVLEDNTEVWLNADSKLKYPDKFALDKREVELIGEGYFKVAKDPERPFTVKSQYMTTRVLGTEFNFRSYSKKDAGVTLVTGQVSVQCDKKDVTLIPGQNACIENNDLKVADVDVKKYTSWVQGMFYFDNVTLEDIMKDLGRWYNVNIKFENAQTKNYKFKFWANKSYSFQQAINMLNQIGKVSIEIDGNQAIIKEK